MVISQRIYHIWNISKWSMKLFLSVAQIAPTTGRIRPSSRDRSISCPKIHMSAGCWSNVSIGKTMSGRSFLLGIKPLMERSLEFGLIIPVVGAIWATGNNTVHHTAVGYQTGRPWIHGKYHDTLGQCCVNRWMNEWWFVWVWNDVTRQKTAGISRRRNEDFSNESNTKIC